LFDVVVDVVVVVVVGGGGVEDEDDYFFDFEIITMSSSSSLPSAIEQHEQQDSLSQNTGSSVSQSQGVLTSSSTSSQLSVPILQGQILTDSDHEDNLVKHIDNIIDNFLNRPTLPNPYHGLFTWVSDDQRTHTYNVILLINQPADFI
jgi:hypothetical protein